MAFEGSIYIKDKQELAMQETYFSIERCDYFDSLSFNLENKTNYFVF